MKKNDQKRIAIIGLPGSGKSTFAIELGKALNVSVHHLDRHMFEPNGKKKDKQELLAIEQSMVNEESWIVEGCSMSTLGTRFARADTVIYFQFSRLVCIWRILKRLFNYNETLSKTGCARQVNWRLLKYIWNFEQEKGPVIEELRKQHPNVDFLILKNSKDATRFRSKFKKRNKMVNILGVDNIFFEVGNLAEAYVIYQHLGFKEKMQIPQIKAILFSIGKEEPGLIIREMPSPSCGKLWVEVEDARKVKEELDEMKFKGNLLETATGFTLEVNDPWGNVIGFADYHKRPEHARNTP